MNGAYEWQRDNAETLLALERKLDQIGLKYPRTGSQYDCKVFNKMGKLFVEFSLNKLFSFTLALLYKIPI